MWFSAFRVRNGYPSSVSKSSAKPGRSCIAGTSGALAMAPAAVRTHFPKRVNARLMPSAMAYAARPLCRIRPCPCPRRGIHRFDNLQHLVVLALEAGSAGRPELQRKRHGLASARAAGRDHAAVVSVHEDVPALLRRAARVPDAGDEPHLVRELLADIRRVDEKEGVASHRPCAVPQDGLGHGRLQRLVVQIPAQPLLRVYRPCVVVDHGAATSLSCLFCKSVFYRKRRAAAALFSPAYRAVPKNG